MLRFIIFFFEGFRHASGGYLAFRQPVGWPTPNQKLTTGCFFDSPTKKGNLLVFKCHLWICCSKFSCGPQKKVAMLIKGDIEPKARDTQKESTKCFVLQIGVDSIIEHDTSGFLIKGEKRWTKKSNSWEKFEERIRTSNNRNITTFSISCFLLPPSCYNVSNSVDGFQNPQLYRSVCNCHSEMWSGDHEECPILKLGCRCLFRASF